MAIDPDSLQFVTPIQDYFHIKCPICLSLLLPDAPRLVTCCGNHFCQRCLDNLPTVGYGRQCPLCKETGFTSVPDKNHLRALKASSVLCVKNQFGCSWKGELGDLMSHLSREGDCEYVMLSCIHKCGSSHLRSELQSHEDTSCLKRPASCEYCKSYQSTWQQVNEVHRTACPERPVDCPNGCGDIIPYKSRPLHLTTCPLHVIGCDFTHCGCQWKGYRKLLTEHLQSSWQEHMVGNMKLLTDKVEKLALRMDVVEEDVSRLKVTIQQQQQIIQSGVVNVSEGYGDDDDEDDEGDSDESDTSPWNSFVSGGETRSFFVNVTNVSGRMSSGDTFISRAFYYGSYPGYKMKLHIGFKGGNVSVFAQLYHNKNNGKLKWPFTGSLTIRLKDQLTHINHVESVIDFQNATNDSRKKPTKNRENSGYGYPNFIAYSLLAPRYLVKNKIVFEIPEIKVRKK